jgi:hypothetical protein
MAYRIYTLAADKRDAVDEILKDDILWRQTRFFREGPTLGGKKGETYLYMEGIDSAMERADKLLPPLATRVEAKDAERIHNKIKEDQDNAAQGMGLMFAD